MAFGLYSKEIIISPDYCDMKGMLSPTGAFTMVQAISTEDAELIGIGAAKMAGEGKFWVTSHNRMEFLEPVWMSQKVLAETWAEPCDRDSKRCYRQYDVVCGGKVVIRSRAQWAILKFDGTPLPFFESGFPENYDYPDNKENLSNEPVWFEDDFEEEDLMETYIVRPTDIDIGRHMNNVVYLQRLLDQFSAKTISGGAIKAVEIHYGAQCLEKEALKIYGKQEDNVWRMCIKNSSGKTAVMAAIEFNN